MKMDYQVQATVACQYHLDKIFSPLTAPLLSRIVETHDSRTDLFGDVLPFDYEIQPMS